MGCEDCDRIQEENLKEKNIAYIRIGAANVQIGACDKHFNELRERLGIASTVVHRIKDLKMLEG